MSERSYRHAREHKDIPAYPLCLLCLFVATSTARTNLSELGRCLSYEAGLKRLTSMRYFWINCQNARRFFCEISAARVMLPRQALSTP